jgi:hypothetical protein
MTKTTSAVSASVRTARVVTATATSRGPSARGYRIRDFCEREGISRSTCWNWARKGVVTMARLAPAVGVRVVYAEAPSYGFDDDAA